MRQAVQANFDTLSSTPRAVMHSRSLRLCRERRPSRSQPIPRVPRAGAAAAAALSACSCMACTARAGAAAAESSSVARGGPRAASWSERFFARAMATGMGSYEAAVEKHKR